MTINHESAIQQIEALPCWSGEVSIEPLSGGLSNLNFLVDDGKKYVVRMVGNDEVIHNVMRFNEINGLNAALAVDLTPAMFYNEPGIMVIDYVEGKTYEAADVCEATNLKRIVDTVRILHERAKHYSFGPCLAFWVFRVNRSYAQLLREGNSPMVPQLDRFMAENDLLENAVGQVTSTFCHNDLLCANFIDSGDKIWLIDWEHCGYGARLFDLANIASNAEMPEDLERLMLTEYYEQEPDESLWRRYKAFRAGSHLREAMWSMASEIHLDLDIDYAAYTRENLDAFEVALDKFKQL